MLEDIKLLKGMSALSNYFIKFASINVIIAASSAMVSIFFATYMAQDIFKEYFIGISLVLVLSNILPLGLIGAITVYKAHITNTQHILLLKLTLGTILTFGVVTVIVSFLWSQGDYLQAASLLPIISYAVCYCYILAFVTYFQVTDKFTKATVLVVVSQSSIFGVLVVWNLLDLTLYYYFLFIFILYAYIILISFSNCWFILQL